MKSLRQLIKSSPLYSHNLLNRDRWMAQQAGLLQPDAAVLDVGAGIHQEPYHFYGGFTPWWYEKFLSEAGFLDIVVEPNAGSFMFYSQESLRFLQMSRPFRLGMPFPIEVMWAPLWALLALVLGGLIPVVCSYLDRFEPERRFTVGYHVTAVKA